MDMKIGMLTVKMISCRKSGLCRSLFPSEALILMKANVKPTCEELERLKDSKMNSHKIPHKGAICEANYELVHRYCVQLVMVLSKLS